MSNQWTFEQQQAIETVDRNLLVSAAAGSGKTAVLAERFAYLVCDAPDFCDIDEILVVTFTNDAAAEMKRRIARTLNQRLKSSFDPRLKRQAMLVHSAGISTIHGMASSILRRHFHVVGIDPNFRLLDEEESRLLRSEVASQLLEEKLDEASNDDIRVIVRDYCDGRVEQMKHLMLSIHAKLSSLLDPWEWLEGKIKNLEVSASGKPLESNIGKLLHERIISQLGNMLMTAEKLQDDINAASEVAKYQPAINEIVESLRSAYRITQTNNWEQIRTSIDSNWSKLPSITGKSTFAARMKSRIDAIKKEIGQMIESNLFHLSETRLIDGLLTNAKTARIISQFVKEFEDRYQREKGNISTLDFNDLERYTLQLLRQPGTNPPEPTAVALEYQKQYKHIMVDEYQDVNELQETILSLISAGGKHFAVGDVKQSIYRFRQADPRCFISRRQRYLDDPRKGRVIDLQKNFRSRGPLLEVLNQLFELLMTRQSAEIDYDESQKLFPGATYPETAETFSGKPMELHLIDADSESEPSIAEELETTEREAVLTAGRILELLGRSDQPRASVSERDGSIRAIEPRDIVVLLRSAAMKAEVYATMLRRAGIPVQADSKTGFFSAIEVMDLINLLKLLCNARDDIALASFLRSPLCGVERIEDMLATMRMKYSSGKAPCFHQVYALYVQEQTDWITQKLIPIDQRLRNWRDEAQSKNVSELLWKIIDDTALLAYLSGLPDGQQRIANVMSLYERAREFEAFQQPMIHRFVDYLRNLDEEDADQGLPPVPGASVNAVRVMTIHRSKGLEFPVVIIPDLGKKINFRDGFERVVIDETIGIATRVVDRRKMIHFPSLGSAIAKDSLRRKAVAEELRVLYVAATRAKEHLILIGRTSQTAIDRWQEQWADHVGAIPADYIIRCSTPLDWIGPATAIISPASPQQIKSTIHTIGELDQLGNRICCHTRADEISAEYFSLKPIQKPVTPDSRLMSLIERMAYQYPFQDQTQQPAAVSVSAITKEGKTTRGGTDARIQPSVRFDHVLKMPRCLTSQNDQTAADIGTITHTLLQYVNFAEQLNDDYFGKLIEQLVALRVIRKESVRLVDFEAIRWFAGTKLGARLAASNLQIHRELNIAFPNPNNTGQLVRGRIDLTLFEPDQITVIDYKTDRVTQENLPERTEFYRPQVAAYSEQIKKIARVSKLESYLVFLHPRVIMQI